MPSTGPAGSNTGSILAAVAPARTADRDGGLGRCSRRGCAGCARARTARATPMPIGTRRLRDRAAGDLEQVDRLGLAASRSRPRSRPVAAGRRPCGAGARSPARRRSPASRRSPPPRVDEHVALEVLDELAHQLRRHVGEHAPAELRDLAGDRQVGRRRRRLVPSPSSLIVTTIVAFALPCPRCRGRTRRARCGASASSTSASFAVPLYCAVIGPTLTFTTPRYSSPSTSCSCAPGRHGAMRSMSSSTFHVSSIGRAHSEAVC